MPHRRGAVVLPQQRFADKECVEAGGAETINVRARFDPALRDAKDAVRNLLRQPLRRAEVDAEIAQVAIVDADDSGAAVYRAFKFRFVMNFDERRSGGTGRRFDWSLLATYERSKPFFLSGGLTPENVVAAVSMVRPDAIDVASGVEASPGIKDHDKVARLFERVRRA